MSDEPPRPRLDPDRAAAEAASRRRAGGPPEADSRPPPGRPPPADVDVRRYRWAIGVFGLVLVIAFSVYQLSSHGLATPGIPAGQRLHNFAAPLAGSNLNGDANLDPPCTEAGHDPRALNLCLLLQRTPLVLAFFSPSSQECEQQVDAMQAVARQFRSRPVHFAAVAVHAGHRQVADLVRSHRWTIPVAYDRDGAVASLYDVELCPLVELARPGGVVDTRLLGNRWLEPRALAGQVRRLLEG